MTLHRKKWRLSERQCHVELANFTHYQKMEDREEALGFKPQKDKIYNKFLPYVEHIDDESIAALAEIKGNLAKAVLLRDIKVGATFWVGQLTRYDYVNKISDEGNGIYLGIKLMNRTLIVTRWIFFPGCLAGPAQSLYLAI